MKLEETIIGIAAALVVGTIGAVLLPLATPGRIMPALAIETANLGGLSAEDAAGVLARLDQELQKRTITIELAGQQRQYPLAELGISLDIAGSLEAAARASVPGAWFGQTTVAPVLAFDEKIATARLHQDLAPQMQPPRDATLRLGTGGALTVVRGAPGDQIDILAFEQDVKSQITRGAYGQAIALNVISGPASIQDDEVEAAKTLAEQILREGFTIPFEEEAYRITPFTARRILSFVPQPDATDPDNQVLGVAFDEEGLKQFLTTTIAPGVDQPAVNARFEIEGDASVPDAPHDDALLSSVQGVRVTQFALPQRGQALDIDTTAQNINQALAAGQTEAALVVSVTEPEITDTTTLEELGITSLLAQGVSDFVGSPKNRVHNIRVGASKYHGLIIGPGEEFGFNQYLGPVDASQGYLPELVIKQNVTVPEFGGGLCQVSTTAFRAAIQSGLEITERRNHSYAVSYYGTPGFDATIYPGHTDLRFLNNTPSYILIQTRVEGTKLIFDFWGTDDGREVDVSGPSPYNRQSDGAVKATLTQTVSKDGQTLVEDTFYSNYKSPKLFPKVLSANGEQPPTDDKPTPTPTPASAGAQDKDKGEPSKATPSPSPKPKP